MQSMQEANFQNMQSVESGIINDRMAAKDGREAHGCLESFHKAGLTMLLLSYNLIVAPPS